jgi:hypothetical protein
MRVCLSGSALAPSASSSGRPYSSPFSASEANAHRASTRRQLGEVHQRGEADQRGAVVHSRLPAREVTRETRTEHRGMRPYVLRRRGRLPQRDGRTHCARATRAGDGTALAAPSSSPHGSLGRARELGPAKTVDAFVQVASALESIL